MQRKGKRFGLRTNATLKYCPFCDEEGENCRNTYVSMKLVESKRGQLIDVFTGERINQSVLWILNRRGNRPKYKGCKSSHGRCNSCQNARSPSLPWFADGYGNWTLKKSKPRSYKKAFHKWMKFELASMA